MVLAFRPVRRWCSRSGKDPAIGAACSMKMATAFIDEDAVVAAANLLRSMGATQVFIFGSAALLDCMEVFKEPGRKIPKPSIEAAQWRQRLPRTRYSKLTKQAEIEGVSMNSLVTAIIAEAIGAKQSRQ